MATFININAIIKSAVRLARDNEEMSETAIIAEVLKSVPLADIPIAAREDSKPAKEKKLRASAGTSKSRAIPEDDCRCFARCLFEPDHAENGKLKVMRDDPLNLYGDRCKNKKKGDTQFCGIHSDHQTLGVWDGKYAGRFKLLVEKTESESEEKPAVEKTKSIAEKKAEKAAVEIPEVEEEEFDEEAHKAALAAQMKKKVEEKKAAAKPVAKPAPAPAPAPVEEEEAAEVEQIEIDGEDFLIDADGNVFDMDENKVGVYNITKKKWIQRM